MQGLYERNMFYSISSETCKSIPSETCKVPFSKRVKLSSTNVRLETTVPHKEEIFQVVIDLVKNSSYFKAFTISADISEIFMQQFWYSIKKVQGMDSYKFLLANKTCVVNADVFRTILDICPRVKGVNFTNVPDDDTTLAFLIKLGYKGPLYKCTNMLVDHMHQPWRTLAAIINKCLSRKTASNDKLREDYQEYGLPILETILTEATKQSEFIKYSTESEPEPEPVKRKTSSKRIVKKKLTLFADENIISDDPDTAFELGKSISQTEAEEAEEARQVHATHARIVTEYVPEPTKRRKSSKVTFDPPKTLKGAPSLTLEEQEASDIMQDLKESDKISKRQPSTEGLSEATGTKLGVLDESTVVSATSSKGTEQESEHSKEDKLDDEEKDGREEMINAEGDDYYKGDEEITDAVKEDAKKTSEVKDDPKKAELPPSSSSLSVSLGFGDQLLKISSDSSLVITVKDITDAEINSLLEVKIQSKVPHTQSASMLSVPVSIIFEPTILTPVSESHSKAIIKNENAIDKGVADTVQDHKTKHNDEDDDKDPPAEPNQGKKTKRKRTKESKSSKKPSSTKKTLTGKATSKGFKTGKTASAKELVEEPIAEVVVDDAVDDVVHDDDQPQDASEPNTAKTLNQEWFKQPSMPPTPDLE
nr:hypothetical protein [Tanacetum cinerariifolium]